MGSKTLVEFNCNYQSYAIFIAYKSFLKSSHKVCIDL